MKLPPPIELNGRRLWADGTSEVAPERLSELLFSLTPQQLRVTSITPEVDQLNELIDHPITLPTGESDLFPPEFILPDRYKYLDVVGFCCELGQRIKQDALYEQRVERLGVEIQLFLESGLEPVIKVLAYVLDTMSAKGVVWGVGRGSSCSSYLLYLMGLHEVDPVRYDIPITDFIRQTHGKNRS